VVDAGDNAAAAEALAAQASTITPAEMATALNLPADAVASVAPPTVAVEFKAADEMTEQNTVSWGFDVAAYDPASSPANYAAALAAKMGVAPADVTVTAKKNADGTWTVSVEVDAGADAAAAALAKKELDALTPAALATALDLPAGSVMSIKGAESEVEFVAPPSVATVVLTLTASGSVSDYTNKDIASWQEKIANAARVDPSLVTIDVAAASVRITATIAVPASTTADAVKNSLSSSFGTAAKASKALGVTVEGVPTITTTGVETTVAPGGGLAAPLDDGQGSNQTVAEDAMSAGAIICIIIVVLLLLLPLGFIAYARFKFGEGKELDFLRYKLSHSNAMFPVLYMPKDLRAEKLSQLYTKPQMVGNQPELDDLAPGQAPGGGETDEEKKMRLYFEGEKKGEKI